MFGQHARPDAILSTREILQVALVTLGLLTAHWIMRDTSIEAIVTRLPRWSVGAVWFLMAGAIIITQGSSNAFIYFQF
jgi:alginate O-acetyltransferase complex protein AlgI